MHQVMSDRIIYEYKDKKEEVVVGVVKRIEFGNLIIDLGKSEAIIKREELIPREAFKNGDRVRAYKHVRLA